MRPFWAALLVALLVSACSTPEAAPPAPEAGDSHALACAEGRPVSAVYDAVSDAVGHFDPQVATQEFLAGELGIEATRIDRLGSVGEDYRSPGDALTITGATDRAGGLTAVAYVRRAGGGGWLVDTVEYCGSGE